MQRNDPVKEAQEVDRFIRETSKFEKLGDDIDKSPAQVSKFTSKKR